MTTICTDKTVTTRRHGSWPKTFWTATRGVPSSSQGFSSFAPCNSLHSTNSTYHRHERGKGKRISRESSASNVQPSPHCSYPQVVDGSPLPWLQLPKETGWPHCHQAHSASSGVRLPSHYFSQQSRACVDRDPFSCLTKSICLEDYL